MTPSENEILHELLHEVKGLKGRFDTLEGRFDTLEERFDSLEGKVDSLTKEFRDFREYQEGVNTNQEAFNNAIWNLNNQAFQSVNEVRNEVLPPWKARRAPGGAV